MPEVYLTASWGWTALWKRAATATLSSWGGNWGRSVSGRWRQRWASGRDRTLQTASGQLLAFWPESETLENEGQFANFCFGQGELLATPLQVAGMMNTIAAGGVYHTPLFVECTVDETTGEELTPLAHSSSRRVFSVQTAEKLQELLAGVVAEGTGPAGRPLRGDCRRKDRHRPDRPVPGRRRAEKLLVRRFLPRQKSPAGPSW